MLTLIKNLSWCLLLILTMFALAERTMNHDSTGVLVLLLLAMLIVTQQIDTSEE